MCNFGGADMIGTLCDRLLHPGIRAIFFTQREDSDELSVQEFVHVHIELTTHQGRDSHFNFLRALPRKTFEESV
jgi:hypothetical protein